MPYDGSGNFTIINSFEEDRINNVSIDSGKMDANFNDVASGLSNTMLRSGISTMTGVLNMGSHKIQNLTAGTASTDAVNKGQMDTALSAKQATITGGASTITSSNLTASRALVSSSSGKVAVSAATATELGYLSGVTSAIQTQINTKAPLSNPNFTGNPTVPTQTYTDNSTKAASTAFVKIVLNALYPVNSIYITMRDSCPLATLISGSTWEKVATSVVTEVSIPSSIAVYGNGKVIGLTNGTKKDGLGCTYQNNQLYTGASDSISLGSAVSSTAPSSSTFNQYGKIGLVTDTNGNSGIVAKSNSITKTSLTINIWKRTA